MNWSSVSILAWILAGIVVAGLGVYGLFPTEWSVVLALSGLFAYVLDRTVRDAQIRNNIREFEAEISRNTALLQKLDSDATATVIANIADPKHWVDIEGRFWVYNGLWTLPADEFNETFEFLIRTRGVRWRVVFFTGQSKEDFAIASTRYQRMQKALSIWKNSILDLEKSFEVRIVSNSSLPGSTFFLTERDSSSLVRLYVDVLKRSETPRLCFEIPDPGVVQSLESEFDAAWNRGVDVTVAEVLASNSLEEICKLQKIPLHPSVVDVVPASSDAGS